MNQILSTLAVSIFGLGLLQSSAFANPSNEVLADCGRFKVTSTMVTDPSGQGGSESLTADYADGTSVKLEPANGSRAQFYGSKVEGSKLLFGNLNSETDVYVEILFPGQIQSFTVGWGKRGETKNCSSGSR